MRTPSFLVNVYFCWILTTKITLCTHNTACEASVVAIGPGCYSNRAESPVALPTYWRHMHCRIQPSRVDWPCHTQTYTVSRLFVNECMNASIHWYKTGKIILKKLFNISRHWCWRRHRERRECWRCDQNCHSHQHCDWNWHGHRSSDWNQSGHWDCSQNRRGHRGCSWNWHVSSGACTGTTGTSTASETGSSASVVQLQVR